MELQVFQLMKYCASALFTIFPFILVLFEMIALQLLCMLKSNDSFFFLWSIAYVQYRFTEYSALISMD